MFKHILIATDGSPVANKAARAGIALATRLAAKVTALTWWSRCLHSLSKATR